MNENDTLKMTQLDKLTTMPQMQMLKAALPYFPLQTQRVLALITKLTEFRAATQLYQDSPDGELFSICEVKPVPNDPVEMLNEIKTYGSPSEQSSIEFLKNMLQAINLYQRMDNLGRQQAATATTGGEEELRAASLENNPQLKNMDPVKLQVLKDLVSEAGKQSKDSMVPFLMSLSSRANQMNVNFTDSETELIINVLKQKMSPEEQSRIDMIRQMAKMMSTGK